MKCRKSKVSMKHANNCIIHISRRRIFLKQVLIEASHIFRLFLVSELVYHKISFNLHQHTELSYKKVKLIICRVSHVKDANILLHVILCFARYLILCTSRDILSVGSLATILADAHTPTTRGSEILVAASERASQPTDRGCNTRTVMMV